jgi:DNA (cytosine-5)-methyltransferase 1
MKPTCKSYFSGAGGLDRAMSERGIDVIQSLDIDKRSCETISMNMNHSVRREDIRKVTVLDQPKSDIIAITYPCNTYSDAAEIHGKRIGDELFLHSLRHVVLEQPEAWTLENVPGMRKFKIVMEAFTKLPNYYITVFCPVDASLWLPQRRERLIIIATKKRHFISAPKPPRHKPRLKDILERNPHVDIPDYVYRRLKGKYRDMPIICDPSNSAELAPTCVAHYAKDLSTRLVKDANYRLGVRPFTVREYARLQGFPDDYQFAGSRSDQLRQIGNAVAGPVGSWMGKTLYDYFNKKR